MSQNQEVVPDCLKIGEWQFRVTAHELERNGITVRLEPRAASLLLDALFRPAGENGKDVAGIKRLVRTR